MVTNPKEFDGSLEPKRWFAVAPSAQPASGLCANCRHQLTCMNHARSASPVMNCEDHETEIVLTAVPDSPIFTRVVPPSPEARTGLCANCDYQYTCSHPRAEGGVWHCEDYR